MVKLMNPGGAAETLAEGESAVFFRPQTSEALTEAVRSFDPSTFAPEIVRKNALRFDKSSFKQRVEDFVNARWEEQKAVVGRLEGSA